MTPPPSTGTYAPPTNTPAPVRARPCDAARAARAVHPADAAPAGAAAPDRPEWLTRRAGAAPPRASPAWPAPDQAAAGQVGRHWSFFSLRSTIPARPSTSAAAKSTMARLSSNQMPPRPELYELILVSSVHLLQRRSRPCRRVIPHKAQARHKGGSPANPRHGAAHPPPCGLQLPAQQGQARCDTIPVPPPVNSGPRDHPVMCTSQVLLELGLNGSQPSSSSQFRGTSSCQARRAGLNPREFLGLRAGKTPS